MKRGGALRDFQTVTTWVIAIADPLPALAMTAELAEVEGRSARWRFAG